MKCATAAHGSAVSIPFSGQNKPAYFQLSILVKINAKTSLLSKVWHLKSASQHTIKERPKINAYLSGFKSRCITFFECK